MNGTLKEQLQSHIIKSKNYLFPKIKDEQIVKGTIVYLTMDESDGLILKDGYDHRNKFIVIIGIQEDIIIGSLLINTNKTTSRKLAVYQKELSLDDYPDILFYNSWLDCSRIFAIPKSKVLDGGYSGSMKEDDFKEALDIIINCDVISKIEKKQFNLL